MLYCMLKKKSLNVMGEAETFLQQEGEVDVPGYVWYWHNRVREKHAGGGVGMLVRKKNPV